MASVIRAIVAGPSFRGLLCSSSWQPGRPWGLVGAGGLEDLSSLRAQGVTEVFFDLNLSPLVGFADADPAAALDYAERVLDDLAPRGG